MDSGRSELTISRVEGVLSADVGEETVLYLPDTGLYFSLNPVAATAWRVLAEPRTFAALLALVHGQFDVDVDVLQADLSGLLDTMREQGLLRVGDAAPSERV